MERNCCPMLPVGRVTLIAVPLELHVSSYARFKQAIPKPCVAGRTLPGAPCDVAGHRSQVSRDIVHGRLVVSSPGWARGWMRGAVAVGGEHADVEVAGQDRTRVPP